MTRDEAVVLAMDAGFHIDKLTWQVSSFYASLAASGFAVVPVEATDAVCDAADALEHMEESHCLS